MKIEYEDVCAFYELMTNSGDSLRHAQNPVAVILYRITLGLLNYMNWPKDKRMVPDSMFRSNNDATRMSISLTISGNRMMQLDFGMHLVGRDDPRLFSVDISGKEAGEVNVDDEESLRRFYDRASNIMLDKAREIK